MPSRVARRSTCPSYKPADLRPSSNCSVFIALLPSKLISLIEGRSTNCTTSTSWSRQSLTSSKLPVANTLLSALAKLTELTVSPIFTGKAAKTDPEVTRCKPSIRISEIVNAVLLFCANNVLENKSSASAKLRLKINIKLNRFRCSYRRAISLAIAKIIKHNTIVMPTFMLIVCIFSDTGEPFSHSILW